MRIIILLLLLPVLTAIEVSAQKKLKYDIIKNTGDTMYYTPEDRIYVKAGSNNSVGEILKTTVYKTGSNFRLAFFIQTGRTSVFSVEQNSEATIRLEDGSTVTLSCRSDNYSKPSHMAYGCFMYVFYQLTPSAIRQLKSSPVSFIRIQSSTGNMDYEIKSKQSGTIADQLEKFQAL